MSIDFSIFQKPNYAIKKQNSGKAKSSGATRRQSPSGLGDIFSLNPVGTDEFSRTSPQDSRGLFSQNVRVNPFIDAKPDNLPPPADANNIASLAINLINAKDSYTCRHSLAARQYVSRFTKRLGLSKEESEAICVGSSLHDIGKLGVSDSILKSTSPLTEEEFAEIKQHPEIGYKMLEGMPAFSGTVAKVVKHHHENWDGTGYPDGLAGKNIPLGARIVAIADSYDAMTSNRPYRKALSREEAIKRLQEGAARQWDPALVEEFIKTL